MSKELVKFICIEMSKIFQKQPAGLVFLHFNNYDSFHSKKMKCSSAFIKTQPKMVL